MLQAVAELDNGRKLMLLGLSKANVMKLMEGKPIKLEADHLGYPGFITIFVGESEMKMKEQLESLIGPDTVVHIDPRLETDEPDEPKKEDR